MFDGAVYVGVRLRTRFHLWQQGYGRDEINHLIDAATDEVIDHAAREANAAGVVGKLGDGTLIQRVIDFLKSPEGQALVKILISILLAAIAA